jgi:hypothetical protein
MGLADDFLATGQRISAVNIFGDSRRIAHVSFGSLETLYRVRVDRDRPRLRRAMSVPVDQAALDASACQFVRNDQPGWTGPDDQHALPVAHGYPSFKLTDRPINIFAQRFVQDPPWVAQCRDV